MANLNEKLRHTAHLPRTSFNMNQGFVFTSSTGMILPVYSDLLNVGETVYINSSLMQRSQPIVTAAMADIHFSVDWFFVPMSMLFTLWPSLRWNTNDPISDFYAEADGRVLNVDRYLPLYDINKHMNMDGDNIIGEPSYVNGLRQDRFGMQGYNIYRLADMLGFNPMNAWQDSSVSGSTKYNPNVFPWRALAYQCIYNNYYINEDYEQRNVKSYNCDSAFNNSSLVGEYSTRQLFYLRFAQKRHDYFYNTRPAPYLSGINLMGLVNDTPQDSENYFNTFKSAIKNYLQEITPTASNQANSAAYITPYTVPNPNGQNFASVTSSVNNTSALRQNFAIEKLMRIVGMSKKDYDSQVLAHFGFKVPHDVKHELTHIFGQHGIMHIGEVVSQSDTFDGTNGSALGAIGGKGYMLIQKEKKSHKFTAPVDGILMAVTYAVPDFCYADVFDKQNAITHPNDFFNPEFDNLGAQPLYYYEVGNYHSFADQPSAPIYRVGWQSRYAQWKQKYNRATMAFYNNKYEVNTFAPWVLTSRPLSFVAPETDPRPYTPDFQNFLCRPDALNGIMQVRYNTDWFGSEVVRTQPWLIYQTDPFIGSFYADVNKISTMSPTGEPSLNGL